MRIAFVLPGLHRVRRGAEIAFESIAHELAKIDGIEVTLFGSGQPNPDDLYRFIHVGNIPREYFEKWPHIKPVLRNERVYEEMTFVLGMMSKYCPQDFDITITCSYPFVNWFLTSKGGKKRPAHVFVTQNSDNPARWNHAEWRFFSCDALVCTNLEYFERHKNKAFCKVITNGVDLERFFPGKQNRSQFDLPEGVPLVLMVSALMPSKRVIEGIQAAAHIEGLHMVVCGDGPEREKVKALGKRLMPGRFFYRKLSYDQMPDIYRAADVFLHMSMDEPFGNVYIEATATGLPVVAHNREVSQWILEDTSILVDTTQEMDVGAAINQALQLNTENEIAKRRNLVENRYSWKNIGESYLKFLNEVLEKKTCGFENSSANKFIL